VEKAKPRGNILSFEVYQSVRDEIVGQQPHYNESHELKQDALTLGLSQKGTFCGPTLSLNPLIFFQKVGYFWKEFVLAFPGQTLSPSLVVFV